jgi:hypothetical protein
LQFCGAFLFGKDTQDCLEVIWVTDCWCIWKRKKYLIVWL